VQRAQVVEPSGRTHLTLDFLQLKQDAKRSSSFDSPLDARDDVSSIAISNNDNGTTKLGSRA